ncbi:hypothetical protein [Halobaculum marinum]|uniref:Uncharacterized protein n=1 Tax=Halobaculum marinum TaxID=3031996 RepID=A0ABD5WY86_9EURY|nr:hypothetical protein [Halobaculum sp. DT55]
MDEALRQRLDAIESRQRIVIALLVIPYVLGVLQFALSFDARGIVLTVGAMFFAILLGIGYVGYRGRQPSRR